MGIVESIKKNHDKYQATRGELINKLESQFRQWPNNFNKKFINTLNVPEFLESYLHFFDHDYHDQKVLLKKCEPLKNVYTRLHAQLGEESYVGEWFTLEQQCIEQFAKVTGDQQWIHTDPLRASKESPFKTTIAQGFLTLALIPFLTDSVDPDKSVYPEARMVVNYGLNHVHFPFPVKVGKRIRARSRVVKLVPMKRGLEIVREVRVEIENSTRMACIAETVIRLYF
jgi:acyl dehydratase